MIDQNAEQPKDYAPQKYFVGVYGTLKKGESNHGLLSDSKFIGGGFTLPKFSLISLGGFPGILPGDSSVSIEVYKVDEATFKRLDRLEGHPSFYTRKIETVILDALTGTIVDVWIYQLAEPKDYKHYDTFIHEVAGHLHWSRFSNEDLRSYDLPNG